jgi:hypothetical protein
MKGKKILFLFLALLLPICIFLFLKIFGKNEFDVPPLHQQGAAPSPQHCRVSYTVPYTLPDSVMTLISTPAAKATLFIVNFSGSESVLDRVREENGEGEVQIISPQALATDPVTLRYLKNCILLLPEPHDLVLVDSQKRIRGYYTSADREEIDRLLVEVNIILKKY